MSLAELHIHHLRALPVSKYLLHPKCNLIVGPNGSGKTSLLEAIYLLGTGHSFKTREILPLVHQSQSSLTLFAKLDDGQTLSLQKSKQEPMQVRLNNEPCRSSSTLAYFLPCQVFYQDIFTIMDAGPAVRRRVLDWGMFHVKHSYLSLWNDYRRALKQRNALLRQRAKREAFLPWETIMGKLAVALTTEREQYFEQWSTVFNETLAHLSDCQCHIRFFKGWDKKNQGHTLIEQWHEQFKSDCHMHYTQSGPHQADILLEWQGHKLKQTASRGQQKIILIALKLAQARMLEKPCVYLMDDIAAELDDFHLRRLMHYLNQVNGQVFFTSIRAFSEDIMALWDDYQRIDLGGEKPDIPR